MVILVSAACVTVRQGCSWFVLAMPILKPCLVDLKHVMGDVLTKFLESVLVQIKPGGYLTMRNAAWHHSYLPALTEFPEAFPDLMKEERKRWRLWYFPALFSDTLYCYCIESTSCKLPCKAG